MVVIFNPNSAKFNVAEFGLNIEVKKVKGSTKLPEGQNFFSRVELKSQGLSHYQVNKLVSEGKLIKLNRSHYENA